MWIRSLLAVFFARVAMKMHCMQVHLRSTSSDSKLVSVVGKEVIELIHEEIDKEISGKFSKYCSENAETRA